MEFRQLRYFTRIVELGSFSRAARSLHIAQPALSTQIAQLEDELGVRLLNRTSRGVAPTEAGDVLYRQALGLLKSAESAKTLVAECGGSPGGRVAVGFPQSLTGVLSMPFLKASTARLAGVRLEVFDELSGDLVSHVISGRIDVALVFDDGGLEDVRLTPIWDEMLYLILAPDHFDTSSAPVPLTQLGYLPLLLPGPHHGVRAQVELALSKHGLRPRVEAELNSFALLRQATLEGMGMTLLPWSCVAGDIHTGKLAALAIDPPLMRRLAICRALEPASLAAEKVSSLLFDTVRRLPARLRWKGIELSPAAG